MKWFGLMMICLAPLLMAQEGRRADRWADFRYLVGTWKMEKPGEVVNVQTYEFMFRGTFLKMSTRSVFEPTEKKPEGEIHEDLGIFSYDGFRDKVMLRSFHGEGFINTYVLDSRGEDGKTLIFISESIENAPPGTRARLEISQINHSEFTQKFFVAWPDKDFNCLMDNHFIRAEAGN